MFATSAVAFGVEDKFENFEKLPLDAQKEILKVHLEQELKNTSNLDDFEQKVDKIKSISKGVEKILDNDQFKTLLNSLKPDRIIWSKGANTYMLQKNHSDGTYQFRKIAVTKPFQHKHIYNKETN